jgi:hypothetical protein
MRCFDGADGQPPPYAATLTDGFAEEFLDPSTNPSI